MKTNNAIPLVLILLLTGSIAYYALDFDEGIEVKIDLDEELNLDREIESALQEALEDVDEAMLEVDEAMDEIDNAFDEVDEAFDEIEAELGGIDRDLDEVLEEVRIEIEKNKDIEIRRDMTKEEVEAVRKKVKAIVRRIIREALDDEPKLEEKP